MSVERAYSWYKIVKDLPANLLLSAVVSFAVVYWYIQDKKDREGDE